SLYLRALPSSLVFLSMIPRLPCSPLFPYTTLFRSVLLCGINHKFQHRSMAPVHTVEVAERHHRWRHWLFYGGGTCPVLHLVSSFVWWPVEFRFSVAAGGDGAKIYQ